MGRNEDERGNTTLDARHGHMTAISSNYDLCTNNVVAAGSGGKRKSAGASAAAAVCVLCAGPIARHTDRAGPRQGLSATAAAAAATRTRARRGQCSPPLWREQRPAGACELECVCSAARCSLLSAHGVRAPSVPFICILFSSPPHPHHHLHPHTQR